MVITSSFVLLIVADAVHKGIMKQKNNDKVILDLIELVLIGSDF